jgi:hypothetical protein
MSTNLPAVISDQAIMPATFEGMMKQAEVLLQSGLLPVSIKTPAAAVAVMLAGREMGLAPMHAFRVLYPINGNVTISAQYMAARLIMAGVTYDVLEMTEKACEIRFKRDNGMTLTYRYTIEDAQRAGLTNKPNWKGFPKDMLYNRCMALGARKIAPDVLEGFYTPDEVDTSATVNVETGEVIDVTPRVVEEPRKVEGTVEAPKAGGWETWPERGRAAFWAKASELGLSKDVVHCGFGVESMKEFPGTMDDAKVILSALDYAVNKTTIGVVGLHQAISDQIGGHVSGVVMQEGATFSDIKDAVDRWISEQAADGATIQRQQEIPL